MPKCRVYASFRDLPCNRKVGGKTFATGSSFYGLLNILSVPSSQDDTLCFGRWVPPYVNKFSQTVLLLVSTVKNFFDTNAALVSCLSSQLVNCVEMHPVLWFVMGCNCHL